MKNIEKNALLEGLSLGKETSYPSQYDPALLQPVPRELNRRELEIVEQQPFFGGDVWHAYELSWLTPKNKPVVALARCTVPYNSPNIVESKSFKLYLNSFNQSQFVSEAEVKACLQKDLSRVAGATIQVELFTPDDLHSLAVSALPGICLDGLDVEIQEFELNSQLLDCRLGEPVTETIHSHLLKSNCLITNQPDWASVVISYQGGQINHAALLRYLVSFRQHNEFHEQCVERIYMDILRYCQPKELTVQAFYTRRGGLDINPFRTSDERLSPPLLRINRQ